jgi:hypothetical protein
MVAVLGGVLVDQRGARGRRPNLATCGLRGGLGHLEKQVQAAVDCY